MAKKKAASGSGSQPRKVTRTDKKTGKTYTYWEGRITTGYDPGTGKQIQKSFTGKTEAEVRKKMAAAAVEVDKGEYKEPSKLTVGEWMNTWLTDFQNDTKPNTVAAYRNAANSHIIPAIGRKKLSALTMPDVQKMLNSLTNRHTGEPLSPASKRLVRAALHEAMEVAISAGLIKNNPVERVDLPKVEKTEIRPLDDTGIVNFLNVIAGTDYENLFTVLLFTGMREGEVLGLTWDNVDMKAGTIEVTQQLQRIGKEYLLTTPKSGKSRAICMASIVTEALRAEKARQAQNQLKAGPAWDNPLNLVFTNALGRYLISASVWNNFKKFAAQAGYEGATVHDLRHSYAVSSLRAGDDIKTVQGNLGHATAAFTMDTYLHVTDQMKQESAARMNAFVDSLKREKSAV